MQEGIYESKIKNERKALMVYKECYERMKNRPKPKDEIAVYEFVKGRVALKKENNHND